MAVPKRKTSPARSGKRRSHIKFSKKNIIEDKKSGELSPPIASTAIVIFFNIYLL